MATTYGYHYGGKINRGDRYEKITSKASASKPKANLGEGHPAKSLEQQLADTGVKAEKNQNIPWYRDAWGRQLYAQEAVKNKNFNAFKKFSDEQIRQMYPDDAQLANYIINGKNGTFMRDVKSLNEDAIAYEKKYGKVSDADVDSIIDAAIQKRDKKSLEDMGILTNDAIERWIDRHPSNSGFGKTGNILKSWRDEPAKYVIEPEVADTNNTSKPAETKADQPAANPEKQVAQGMVENSKEISKEEKPSKNKSIDDIWAETLNIEWHKKYDVDWNNPEAVQNAKENAFRTNDYTSYRSLSDEQIRQLYPDPKEAEALINGKYESAKHKSNPDYDDNYLRYSLMGDTSTYPNYGFPVPVGEIVPPARAKFNKKETVQEPPVQEPPREPLKNNVTIWDSPPMPLELPKKLKSNNPFLLIDPAEFKKTFGDGSIDLNTPYGWSSYPYVRGRGINYNAAQPLSTAQKVVAGLGLGALGSIYGLGSLVNGSQQTQAPYRMEPEPVNETVAQSESTPEQQFVLQSTSPFDYAKIANLFDLYTRYGSPDSIDNSISEEQPADENTPQSDSDVYKNAQEMGQRIASGTGYAPELKKDNFEFPQNPPKVGSSIKTAGLKSPDGGEVPQELNRLSGVKPKVIKDTSKGPVVLNDPNHRKTRDVQNNSVTPEQAVARQMVNQYAEIPAEVVRAKNQPFLTTDAIWNRLRQKGLVSPEEGIRSGLFTPDEVRYITENDLWRYR